MATIEKKTVKEVIWPEKTFITARAKVSFDDLPSFFSKHFHEMYSLLQKLGIPANSPPCAFYYSIDEADKKTDVAAAIPIDDTILEIVEYEKIYTPESKVVTITHIGPFESMGNTYLELENYLSEHKMERELVIEEYLSDPEIEKDPNKWVTNIYFLVK